MPDNPYVGMNMSELLAARGSLRSSSVDRSIQIAQAKRELERATGPVWNPIPAAKNYLRTRCGDYVLADKLLAERSFKAGADLVLRVSVK